MPDAPFFLFSTHQMPLPVTLTYESDKFGSGANTREMRTIVSKDKGQKAAKKPAAMTAKEKKIAKRDKNQAAASILNNRK